MPSNDINTVRVAGLAMAHRRENAAFGRGGAR